MIRKRFRQKHTDAYDPARDFRSWLPNALSLLRVLLAVPVICLLEEGRTAAAVIVYLAAILTDILDGAVARLAAISSETGWIVDSGADTVLVLSLLSYFSISEGYSLLLPAMLLVSYILFLFSSLKGLLNYDPFGRWIGIGSFIVVFLHIHELTEPAVVPGRLILSLYVPLAMLVRLHHLRKGMPA